MEKRQSFYQVVLGKLVKHMQKDETRTLYSTISQKNSKCITALNVRPESIKLLEEKLGRTLSCINHIKVLYDPPPRVMEIKTKMNKLNLIKLKSFCIMKESISQAKRQPSEWEKIIANKITGKELIFKIYK